MNHDAAVLQVPDLVRGELDAATRLAVAGHVDSCEGCQALMSVYRRLLIDLDAEACGLHPLPPLLVAYALRPAELGEEVSRRLLRHLERCAECSADVERIRRAEAYFSSPDSRAGDRRNRLAWWLAATAASLFLVTLGYALHLRLVRLPLRGVESRPVTADGQMIALPPDVARAWPGDMPWAVLTGRLRGAEEPERIGVAAEDLYVKLAVGPMPVAASGDTGLRFTIIDAKGHDAASVVLDAASLDGLLRKSELVYFLVPASRLSAGEHRLVVRAFDEILVDVPFSIQRDGSNAGR